VAKGYSQQEGIDYTKTFASVAHLKEIRILLSFVAHHGMMLYQMDVKSAFLNGIIKEELYVEQPPRFKSSIDPHHVFELNKALYGLKQAPQAWYEKLSFFLTENGFIRGKVDTAQCLKNYGSQFLIVQIYVDDIIFGATNDSSCKDFSKLMQAEFKMSMMEELKFFLGLQIMQIYEGIYIHQTKYVKELLKKFKMDDAKQMKTPMHPTIVLELDKESKKMDEKTNKGMI